MLEFPVLFFKPGTQAEKAKEIESFIELTAKTGYKNIDLIWQTIQLVGTEEIGRMLENNGLKLSCIICMDVAGNIEGTEGLVEACEYLKCKKIMLVPGLPTEDKKELFDLMVRNYTKIVNLAAQKGIICVCEDEPNIKVPCGSREELEAILKAVPGLHVVFDSANMLPSCDEVIPYYEHFADRTAHVHVKDMAIAETEPGQYANPGVDGRFYINAPHGTGVVDFDALFEVLRKHGYDGTLAIEFVPMPDMDLAEDMKRVYDMFASRI
jgi:sugar phosphate isomerase/epimerase